MPAAAAPPAPNPAIATPRPLCLPNAGALATPPNAGVLMPEVSAAPPAPSPVIRPLLFPPNATPPNGAEVVI